MWEQWAQINDPGSLFPSDSRSSYINTDYWSAPAGLWGATPGMGSVTPVLYPATGSEQWTPVLPLVELSLSEVPGGGFLYKICHCTLSHHFSGRVEYTETFWTSCYRSRESLEETLHLWKGLKWDFPVISVCEPRQPTHLSSAGFLISSCPLAQAMLCAVGITQAKEKTELSSSAETELRSVKFVISWISRMTCKVKCSMMQ